MTPSTACYDLIKRFESCRLTAYPDPGTGGVPFTIGWGYTFGVHPGMTITQQQADEWLISGVEDAALVVNQWVKSPLNQNQFDALTSFVYNVGRGMPDSRTVVGREGFVWLRNGQHSTLLQDLNAGAYTLAAGQFALWVHGGNGTTLPGLVTRRAAERELFMTPVAKT